MSLHAVSFLLRDEFVRSRCVICQQVLLKLCAIDEDATSGRAAELLKPFAAKLGKTKLQIGDPVTSKQQERNLVTASVRTLFALHSHSPPHPLASRPEFKDLVCAHNARALRLFASIISGCCIFALTDKTH